MGNQPWPQFQNGIRERSIRLKFGKETQNWMLIHIADSKSGFGDDFGQHGTKTIILCPFMASFRPNASWT